MLARSIVSFGREICGDLPSTLRREWIVTNGLGGYASATLAGITTRRYHGLLVAALSPPVGRTVLVGGLVEWAVYRGRRYPLSTHEYVDGTIDPQGYTHLRAFQLEGMLPIWEFELADAILEKRLWMPYGANTTCVRYRLIRGTGPVDVEVTPLVTYRDFHTLRGAQDWTPEADSVAGGVQIRAASAVPYRLLLDGGAFRRTGDWYWNFLHREEASRGLDSRSDLYAPGVFRGRLQPDQGMTLVATAEAAETAESAGTLQLARTRQDQLLRRAGVEAADPVVQQLTLAADQFIVARNTVRGAGKTVIAGYHWFNDWGRDTVISLPGLTLCTGRTEEGAAILREFAHYVRDGLLPNNFPDQSAQIPGYNTADASLWYLLALRAYHEATGDDDLVDELLPVVREILDRHIEGTHYGIRMDTPDSLLRAGEAGMQLTWMDAKVGGWVVTPRIGKPVEVNALWYNALRTAAAFLSARRAAADRYAMLADRVRGSFRARFLRPEACRLADVVDGPEGDDLTMRPNQIFAVSLPFPLLDEGDAAAVVEAVGKTLLTTYGLRSLSPDDPAYRGAYRGDLVHRDGAYHQGTVWAWLIAAYVDAHYRVHRSRDAALSLLRPFEHHLSDAGLGTVSEIFEGDPPHLPRGCIAQAWSVAEILRVWRRLGINRIER